MTSELDEETTTQFAAMTIKLPNGIDVASFRGTDGTSIGWLEDLKFAFEHGTASEEMATKYLEAMNSDAIAVTGHSKGGHEGIYGATFCNEETRAKILQINNFDGPGLRKDLINSNLSAYNEMKQKLKSIYPSNSIIGQIFAGDEDRAYADTVQKNGFLAHDWFSWQIDENGEIVTEKQSDGSKYLTDVLAKALYDVDPKTFDTMYQAVSIVLGSYGADSFENWGDTNPLAFAAAYGKLTKEQKSAIDKVAATFLVDAITAREEELIDNVGSGIWGDVVKFEIKKFGLELKILAVGLLEFAEDLIEAGNWVVDQVTSISNKIKFRNYDNCSLVEEPIEFDFDFVDGIVRDLIKIKRDVCKVDGMLDQVRDNMKFYEIKDKLVSGVMDFLYMGEEGDLQACINFLTFTRNIVMTTEQTVERNSSELPR